MIHSRVNVHAAKRAHGLTERQLADEAGLSRSAVRTVLGASMEKRAGAPLRTYSSLALAFGLSLPELFAGAGELVRLMGFSAPVRQAVVTGEHFGGAFNPLHFGAEVRRGKTIEAGEARRALSLAALLGAHCGQEAALIAYHHLLHGPLHKP